MQGRSFYFTFRCGAATEYSYEEGRLTLERASKSGRACCLLLIGLFLLAMVACATAPDYHAFTKQAGARGAACNEAAARFAATPNGEMRQDVLTRLKELNAALIETAEYERAARRSNSVDLVDANRAFLETGRAWGNCSLQYNRTLVAIGEVDAARYNYQGLLNRLAGPQFVSERRQIQAALHEIAR